MKSNFSLAEPVHGCTAMGMRFSRKSPAVGSMKRQSPLASVMETPVSARVAVLSNSWAAAAAVGTSSPPARETGTGVVGFPTSVGGAAAEPDDDAEADSDEVIGDDVAGGVVAVNEVVSARRVTVIMSVDTQPDASDETMATAVLAGAVSRVVVDDDAERAAEVDAETVAMEETFETAAELPPKVNDCVASPGRQAAWSRTLAAVTARHTVGEPTGENASGPFPPVKGNNWEFVTVPPPSALPPHENIMTVFPAARRESKLAQA
jgi:hypothetical protein